MNQIHEIWLETLEPLRSAEGLKISLGYFPLPKTLLENSKHGGGNAMDIDPMDGPLIIVLINPTWDSEDDDERIYKAVEDLLAKCKRAASEKSLLHRYLVLFPCLEMGTASRHNTTPNSRHFRFVTNRY